MKKHLGLLLAVMMVMNVAGSVSFAASPLEKYNLYDDVMGGGGSQNQERERVTQDFYNNSMRPGSDAATLNAAAAEEEKQAEAAEVKRQERAQNIEKVLESVNTGEMVGPRNKALRESSRNVYSDLSKPEPWASEKSYYERPSLEGIKESYRKSNFAGALQECISLVNHKDFETLTNEQKTIAYYYLAMSYTKCGQKDNAIRAYEKVISLNDCPMIVKYATNGRNCVMLSGGAPAQTQPNTPAGQSQVQPTTACYQDVNVPELVYPNANLGSELSPEDLIPIDPQTLIDRNMRNQYKKLYPAGNTSEGNNAQTEEKPLNLPFGKQDAALDEFINAPYGNGLSPEFNKEYKEIQLRTIQKKMNAGSKLQENQAPAPAKEEAENPDKKSDLGTIKLAYEPSSEFEKIQNDPEYIQQQREYEQITQMLGTNSNQKDDMADLLPYMTEQGDKKLSPEVIQTLMMQSMMNDLTL